MSRDYILHPFRAPIQFQLDYQRELNPQQYEAVTSPPGPALVIAGAGSGKTRTLTYRVAYLLEQGIPPDRVLLLTFTNKAAREMMRRVADLLGQELPTLWGGTFHSIGSRVLRQHAPALGYGRDFSILDREDAKSLVSACIGESGIDTKATKFPKAEVLADLFSLAVNTHKTVQGLIAEEYKHLDEVREQVAQIHERYSARKLATNAMDFDDLLVLWLRLLQTNAEVREIYQRRFQFVLVDEYQDTNRLQSDLIDLLVEKHHNLTVVGDDAQSIYAWRGANYQNILKFPERYPEAKIFKIEINYRSTPEILSVANATIKNNIHQFAKELSACRKAGTKPPLVVCADSNQQAAFVAQRVLELREEGQSINNIAVLYRSHFHALELQLELTRRNIPFAITSGIRFFEQAHIKDVCAYLKLLTNPQDELSLKRLVQLLPGVGAKAADRIWTCYRTKLSASRADGSAARPAQITIHLQSCGGAVPKKTAVAWAQFLATFAQLESGESRGANPKLIRLILEATYEEHLKATYPNYRARLEDIEQLAAFSGQFPDLQDFLTQLALLTNVDADEEQPKGEEDEQLRLSTVHQAKGLEFDVVFVIMLCEGLFPSSRSAESADGEEEERRLLYVAITRARNELYLCYPLMRFGYGGSGATMLGPSRFLHEIPADLMDEWSLRTYHPH